MSTQRPHDEDRPRRRSVYLLRPCPVRSFRPITPTPVYARGFIRSRLQRIAWKLCRILDLLFADRIELIDYTRVDVDERNLLQVIREMEYSLQRYEVEQCKYLLVGRDYFHLLELEANARIPFARLSEIYGMRVVLVPWMEGIMLVPELGAVSRDSEPGVFRCEYPSRKLKKENES